MRDKREKKNRNGEERKFMRKNVTIEEYEKVIIEANDTFFSCNLSESQFVLLWLKNYQFSPLKFGLKWQTNEKD